MAYRPPWLQRQPARLLLELLPELLEVVDAIVETDSTLATGHLGPQETMDLVDIAVDRGVKRIVITHPH